MKKKLESFNKSHNLASRFPDEKDSWLISFSDIITMLLCFFMIFYSNQQKVKKTEFESLVADLNEKFGVQVLKGNTAEDIKTIIEKKYGLENLYNSLLKLESDKDAQVLNYRDYLSIEFPKGNIFASGSEKLLQEAKTKLLRVVKELSRYRGKVNMTIVAYTDPTPVVHKKDRWWNSNEELSALRALQTQKLFLKNGYIPDEIFITGKGVRKINIKGPLNLKGVEVDISRYNQFRTIAIRIESKE